MRDHPGDHRGPSVAVVNGRLRLTCAVDGAETSIQLSAFNVGRQAHAFVVAHEDCGRPLATLGSPLGAALREPSSC